MRFAEIGHDWVSPRMGKESRISISIIEAADQGFTCIPGSHP
jgi:hypothetical protein